MFMLVQKKSVISWQPLFLHLSKYLFISTSAHFSQCDYSFSGKKGEQTIPPPPHHVIIASDKSTVKSEPA